MDAISPNITTIKTISKEPLIQATEIGAWLNLSPSAIIVQLTMLDELTNAATEILTRYLWLHLKRTTFEAYFNLDYGYFCSLILGQLKLNLERAPIISLDDITKIEYLNNDIWVEFDRGTKTIDGLFENTTEKSEQRQWASIYFKNGITFQDRYNAYKIRVTFTAGFIDNDSVYFLPPTLKLAIKKIVAYHYTNRGDCETDCKINGYPVPCDAKGLVDNWSIKSTILGGSYNPL